MGADKERAGELLALILRKLGFEDADEMADMVEWLEGNDD